MRHLRVSDVLLEASLSRSSLKDNQTYHCKICSKVVITNIKRYLKLRMHFLARKFSGSEQQYCYYILQKIRDQILKISIR